LILIASGQPSQSSFFLPWFPSISVLFDYWPGSSALKPSSFLYQHPQHSDLVLSIN
jgi:hypothetical protein